MQEYCADGEKLCIILIGGEAFPSTIATWLPSSLPPSASILIGVPETLAHQILPALPGASHVQLAPLDFNECSLFLVKRLSEFGLSLGGAQLSRLLEKDHGARPLYLSLAADYLRHQTAEKVSQLVEQLPQTIEQLVQLIMSSLDASPNGKIARQMLEFVSCSNNGLRPMEIMQLMAGSAKAEGSKLSGLLDADVFVDALLLLHPLIRWSGEGGSARVTVSHRHICREIQRAVQNSSGSSTTTTRLLADFFWQHDDDGRWLEEVPFHLSRLQDPRLHDFLSDPRCLQVASHNNALDQLATYWLLVDKDPTAALTKAKSALETQPSWTPEVNQAAADVIAEVSTRTAP